MGFDLHLMPPSGFLEWTGERWDQYLANEPRPEEVHLGKSWYIGLVLDTIAHNLEDDRIGSRFPLLMRIHHDETIGWYQHEVKPLLDEIQDVKKGLATLPINRSTLNYPDDEEVLRRVSDFKKTFPDRPLRNLCDLFCYFFDGYEAMARMAIETGSGLFLSY